MVLEVTLSHMVSGKFTSLILYELGIMYIPCKFVLVVSSEPTNIKDLTGS